ncbi:protein geranylgeranyltransferase type I [Salvia divinorum]|uniref:Protein geranylgeranyltransferase type I n=1 Tax=Salvia divinorum TaxID=28513 RepID=A0ABD1GDM0_SALDI
MGFRFRIAELREGSAYTLSGDDVSAAACSYQGQEINRLTLAYFVISGLDIFGALDRWEVFQDFSAMEIERFGCLASAT